MTQKELDIFADDGVPFHEQAGFQNIGQSSEKICEICLAKVSCIAQSWKAIYYACEPCASQYKLEILKCSAA